MCCGVMRLTTVVRYWVVGRTPDQKGSMDAMLAHRFKRHAAGVACGGVWIFLSTLAAPILLRKPAARKLSVSNNEDNFHQSLEVIIPAYLEHSVIGDAIESLRSQLVSWPGSSRITVVASDEETAEAAVDADQIYSLDPSGKPAAINFGVERSPADIVVFTDANCILSDDWPIQLGNSLEQADLVSGAKSERRGREEGYWKYERLVSPRRTAHASLAVVGEFLALRRSLFEPIPPKTQLDDFWLANSYHRRGYRVVVNPQITTTEQPEPIMDQLERRVRIAAGFYAEVMPHVWSLFGTPEGRSYIMHKPLRMTVGVGAFWASIAGMALTMPPASVVLTVASVAACMAIYVRGGSQPRVIGVIATGVALQTIPPAGLWRAVRHALNGREAGWKKVPR